MFSRQVLVKAPPKWVFQLLYDVTLLEEYTDWTVTPLDDAVGDGFRWEEKHRLRKRVWTMTDFQRRGLQFTATWEGIEVTVAAKKGGPGSCNVRMVVRGDEKQVAKFEKSDGDRLERFLAYLQSE